MAVKLSALLISDVCMNQHEIHEPSCFGLAELDSYMASFSLYRHHMSGEHKLANAGGIIAINGAIARHSEDIENARLEKKAAAAAKRLLQPQQLAARPRGKKQV